LRPGHIALSKAVSALQEAARVNKSFELSKMAEIKRSNVSNLLTFRYWPAAYSFLNKKGIHLWNGWSTQHKVKVFKLHSPWGTASHWWEGNSGVETFGLCLFLFYFPSFMFWSIWRHRLRLIISLVPVNGQAEAGVHHVVSSLPTQWTASLSIPCLALSWKHWPALCLRLCVWLFKPSEDFTFLLVIN
jgi:hypothetical protein